MNWKTLLFIICFGMMSLFQDATAQVCKETTVQDELLYLKRLSLQLRGYLPAVEEYQEVIKEGKVKEATIEKMLGTKDFLRKVRQYHAELLWPNVNNIAFTNTQYRLVGNGDSEPYNIFSAQRRQKWRGGALACANEPVEYDASGKIVCKAKTQGGKSGCQEGYRMITPYWDLSKKVKVCAYDAQETDTFTDNAGKTQTCKGFFNDARCGCGPNLNYCQGAGTETKIRNSIVEQTMRFIEQIVDQNENYSSILTKPDMEVNGILAHYFTNQSMTGGNQVYSSMTQNFTIPKLTWQDESTWNKVKQTSMQSGLLTMPAYLLKFSANRGRANRFYNAFLCQHFQAPKEGLPSANDACHSEPNLMERCGCKYCHTTLEPASSHWGRWAEGGVAPLLPTDFPSYMSTCDSSSTVKSFFCRRFYFVEPNHTKEQEYKGKLYAYVFATKEMENNIDKGPILLAQKAIDNGEFAKCTVNKVWSWLMGFDAGTTHEKRISELTAQFKSNQYNYRKLVQSIVLLNEYKTKSTTKK